MSTAVYIGRFQPFHNGHAQVLKAALEKYERVLVLIGSANSPRTPKNPWNEEERFWMIANWIDAQCPEYADKFEVDYIEDFPYDNERWKQEVVSKLPLASTCVFVGCNKDRSTFYFGLFPEYEKDLSPNTDFHLCGTEIRDHYFSGIDVPLWSVPVTTTEQMNSFKGSSTYEELRVEYRMLDDYKRSWEVAPYPPTFVTVDALVTFQNHVLLIERKNSPGAGLWALPGGFVGQHERMIDAAKRELKEETGIEITDNDVLDDAGLFDHPERSQRGRTITVAYRINLHDFVMPKAGDDAGRAVWTRISELKEMRNMMYEDHYHIICRMLGLDQ